MARQVKNRVHLSDRFKAVKQYAKTYEVAPHTGAWIETDSFENGVTGYRRTPHGCVD